MSKATIRFEVQGATLPELHEAARATLAKLLDGQLGASYRLTVAPGVVMQPAGDVVTWVADVDAETSGDLSGGVVAG